MRRPKKKPGKRPEMAVKNGNGYSWSGPWIIGGILQAFWVVVWGTVTAETSRLQREIDKYNTQAEATYTKKENTEQYRQRVAVEIAALKHELETLMITIRRLRDETISKDAYNGRHDALIDDLKRHNLRIDEIRRDVGGAYTLNDKIKELQDQLKVLQNRAYAKPKE